MDNPTRKAGYTKEDLKEYARYRKQKDIKGIDKVLHSVEDAREHEDYRLPLSVTEMKVVNIQLSWGGDEDGYKLYFDSSGELSHGVYYWADWGVYEEVALSYEEAEKVVEYYRISIAEAD